MIFKVEEMALARVSQPFVGHPARNLIGDVLRIVNAIVFDIGDVGKVGGLPLDGDGDAA